VGLQRASYIVMGQVAAVAADVFGSVRYHFPQNRGRTSIRGSQGLSLRAQGHAMDQHMVLFKVTTAKSEPISRFQREQSFAFHKESSFDEK
jgi:hypothetical protein